MRYDLPGSFGKKKNKDQPTNQREDLSSDLLVVLGGFPKGEGAERNPLTGGSVFVQNARCAPCRVAGRAMDRVEIFRNWCCGLWVCG